MILVILIIIVLYFILDFLQIITFLGYVKGIYAAALGIEILCIAAAEIGENTALYFLVLIHQALL
jgi:hypothetical protein